MVSLAELASSGGTAGFAFASGCLSAVSPCVLVLIPLLLFRFARPRHGAVVQVELFDKDAALNHGRAPAAEQGRAPLGELAWFVAGFECAYVVFGLGVSTLFSSAVQAGIKLGLGCLFAVTGTVSLTDRIDPLHLPVFHSPALMGAAFAALISFNPCTVPFLAVIISMSTSNAMWALVWFGAGLLTPALCFVALGKSFVGSMQRWERLLHALNRAMSLVLVAAGLWLAIGTHVVSLADRIVACTLTLAGACFGAGAFDGFAVPARRALAAVCLALLALALAGLTVLAGSGHVIATHELLGAERLLAAADGSALCVDVSLVAPCPPCLAFRNRLVGLVCTVCAAIVLCHAAMRRAERETVLPQHGKQATILHRDC